MRFPAAFASIALLLTSAALFAETPTPPAVPADPPAQVVGQPLPPPAAVELLSKEDLAAFVAVLREHYIAPDRLTDAEIQRATVQGLLTRFSSAAAILDLSSLIAVPVSPFRTEVLESHAGYVRLGTIMPAHLVELDAALQDFAKQGLTAVILDLRATPSHTNFEEAAEVCKRFCPKGKVLFTVRRPQAKQELILTSRDVPRFRGLLIVLVDSDSAGSAEVIAATLRAHANAMVVGQRTKGEAVEFGQVSLPSGRQMRIAVAEVGLPDNKEAFSKGVTPDVAIDIPQETTNTVLQTALQGGVGPLIAESERPRMNEASLVAGTNPEFDAIQAAQQRARGERPQPAASDVALQRALDLVATIGIYEKKPGKK